MDPTATLDEIRGLIFSSNCDAVLRRLDPDEADRLQDLVLALDEWLSKGGFLPAAWSR